MTMRRQSVAIVQAGLLLAFLLHDAISYAATPFTTNGNFSVGSDGSASYSIPIQVPPGTAGMSPAISLNYNSNGGNGILGMGWGLDGLSQISRCPQTLAQDNQNRGVMYDTSDKMCLDGQRLISTGGTYGANGTEYRTEQANFARIISYTTTPANGPDAFKVWTKAGQIIEYGNTADSRIEAADKAVVRTWGVNKISDTKGNYITVSYTEDNANGEAYVSRMDYTGNSVTGLAPYASVQFIYEARPDPGTGYHAGSIIKTTKRMTNIRTYTTANATTTFVKDYRLVYQLAPNTQRSRLATITECSATTCLAPTVMNWREVTTGTLTNSTPSYAPPYPISSDVVPDLGTRFIDLNGDGLQDYVIGRYVNATTTVNQAWLNTGSGWINTPSYAPPYPISIDQRTDIGTRFEDLNGDGLVDMVHARYVTATNNQRLAWLNTGNGWVSSSNYIPPTHFYADTVPELGTRMVDLNGDGLVDIVQGRYISATSSQMYAWLNTGIRDALDSLALALSSSISLAYKPITNSSIYVKGTLGETGTTECPMPLGEGTTPSTNSYPVINLQEPVYVVSSATVSDGNGGVLTNNYIYGGLKADLKGRGSLGFRYQKVTQADADINSTTFFRQDYPYVGLPCRTERVVTSTNTLIGKSYLFYANSLITKDSAISQFPYLTQSVEQNFELNGNLINTTTKTNQYDGYGNATQIVVNSGDGYSKTTTNVYYNDTSNGNWLLGRLLHSTVTSTAP